MKRIIVICLILSLLAALSACGKAPINTNEGDVVSPDTPAVLTPEQEMDNAAEMSAAEYTYLCASMSTELPGGWTYDTIAYSDDSDVFGLKLYPEAEPDFALTLCFHKTSIGLCGTGVTFEDVTFNNGLSATKCTENVQGNLWLLMIFNDLPGIYTLELNASDTLWSKYEDDVTAIINSAKLGNDGMTEAEATWLAKTVCTSEYDTTSGAFDYTDGSWDISFFKSVTGGGSETIHVSANGAVTGAV